MGDSAIEWTDWTWNPVTGCTKLSPGCKFCYAERLWPKVDAARVARTGDAPRRFIDIETHDDRLETPLHWKRPRRIFVNSMSDLFHEEIDDIFLRNVFAVMAMAPQHTFQVLTKRASRMREWVGAGGRAAEVFDHVRNSELGYRAHAEKLPPLSWPLPNVWLGVSVENQEFADQRIPQLFRTAAAIRFLSCEPLLGPINLWLPTRTWGMRSDGVPGCDHCCYGDRCDDSSHVDRSKCRYCRGTGAAVKVDWVISGGESGPKARPSHPEWHRSLRDQCAAAGVAFLFKQHGEWIGVPDLRRLPGGQGPGFGHYDHCRYSQEHEAVRVGKKAAGRTLDGRLHDEYPA